MQIIYELNGKFCLRTYYLLRIYPVYPRYEPVMNPSRTRKSLGSVCYLAIMAQNV